MVSKIIVAQLGARMHYAIPEILHRNNLLHTFFSDLFLNKSSHYLLSQFNKISPSSFSDKLLGRYSHDLEKANIQAFNWAGMRYSFQSKQAKNPQQQVRQCNRMAKDFNKKILQKGFDNADALYVFNTAGLELIQHAKSIGIKTILEQTIAPFALERVLMENELQKFPAWGRINDYEMNDDFVEYIERERTEQTLSDVIIGGSDFVKSSIETFSGQSYKTHIVPYGINLPPFFIRNSWQRGSRKLRILTIGLGLRKGTPYILKAAKELRSIAEFRLIGSLGNVTDSVKKGITKNVDCQGHIARSAVDSHYQWADIFLLPSLCEGSATVTYEALAYGVPVITTANTGSIIEHNLDGLIIQPQSAKAIEEAILSLYQQPEKLEYFSDNAILKSEFGSIESYENRLLNLINSV